MAKQSTTTVVLHDAHVAARAAAGAAFVAAYQGVCCFIAAVAVAYVARRAVRADRYTAYGVAHATTKAATAARVARKEADEQYASRVAKRAAAKAANAPAVRAAKLHAASVAKLLKAANATRLAAVRATRAAAKAAAVIKAAMAAIDKAYALSVAPVVAPTAATVVRTPRVLKGSTVGLSLEDKVIYKAMRLGARRGATKAPAVRASMNSPEKRAAITLACANARVAKVIAIASHGSVMSQRTIEARAAQGAAQKAANEARKAATPAKTPGVHVVIVRTGPTKSKGAKRVHAPRVHTVESALAQVAKKQAIIKAKEDAAIAKAKKWALRKEAYANRKAAMEVIASDAWMNAGVWLSEDLIRGANDWSYQVRIAAFKEARAIAYPPKTKAVATTGVAA